MMAGFAGSYQFSRVQLNYNGTENETIIHVSECNQPQPIPTNESLLSNFSPYATNIMVIEFCRPQKLKLNVTGCYAKYTVT